MLHSLYILVDSVLVDIKDSKELGEDLVTINNRLCDLLSLRSQDCAAILFVFDESLRVKALEHVGDTGLRDAKALRYINRSGVALFLYEVQDLLKVVVHCNATTCPGDMSTHR